MTTKIINHLFNSIDDNSELTFNHYSGIYRNSKPLYVGCNNRRNVYGNKCTCFTTHAEMDVLQRLLKGEARTTI